MSHETLTDMTTLTIISCGACAIRFALPSSWHAERKNTGKGFYCPRGCSISYHEDTNSRLEREKKALEQKLQWRRDERDSARDEARRQERRAIAYKGHLTRKKNETKRVKHGICPCCDREFQNLKRHMASEHPAYSERGE